MEKIILQVQKIGYGSLFCLGLPLLLWVWARQTATVITLPLPPVPLLGLPLSLLGLGLMLWAMHALWRYGKGLPMNAFPPGRYVTRGPYRLLHHPIYAGAVLVCFGVSWCSGSAAGFWLVSPLFLLLVTSYIIGFEKERTEKHFRQHHVAFFDLPPENDGALSAGQRLAVYLRVFLPWLMLYEAFVFLGVPKDAFFTEIGLDAHIPRVDFSILFYVLLYPLAAALPLVLHTNRQARAFILDAVCGMALIFYCYLVIPAAVNYQPVVADTVFTQLIAWGRTTDSAAAALPSFHVFWALMVWRYWRARFGSRHGVFAVLAGLIIVSCLSTQNHTVLDVLGGAAAYGVIHLRQKIYRYALAACEHIANSWHEWRWGKVRLINHGFYAAAGAFCGFLLMAVFLPDHLWLVYVLGVAGFVGAGLWAQWLEGSSALLRPFGYYGSVAGIMLAALLASMSAAVSLWALLAAAALAACPIQFFGRGRCLVQGCCHGKPSLAVGGIRFFHEKSRVCRIAGWRGQNLHPTQLYSMLANALTFLMLWRLQTLALPAAFIAGAYLILNGAFRFIEESLRGEPQTPYFMGMRVYQWLSLACVLVGMAFTAVPSPPLPAGRLDSVLVLNAALYALVILFVYSVDFPDSQRRFSRLTP